MHPNRNGKQQAQTDSPTAQTAGQREQTKRKRYKNTLFVKETETQKPRQTQTETSKTQKQM